MRFFKIILFIHFFLPATSWTKEPLPPSDTLKNTKKSRPQSALVTTRQKKGLFYFKKKKYKKCISTLAPLLDHLKKRYQLVLSQCYQKKKNYLGQVSTLKQIVENGWDDYNVQYQLGRAHIHLGNEKEAILHFKNSVSLNKKFKPAYDALIQLFMKEQNYYEARLMIEESIKNFGSSPQSLVSLCKLYSKEGYLDETVRICEKAIKTKKEDMETHILLAIAYKDLDQLHQARLTLLKSIQRFPKNYEGYESLGYYYLGKKNYPLALKYFKKSSSLSSHSTDTYLGLAQSAYHLKKYKLSLQSFLKSCPGNTEAFRILRNYTSEIRAQKNYKWMGAFENTSRKCRYLTRKKK